MSSSPDETAVGVNLDAEAREIDFGALLEETDAMMPVVASVAARPSPLRLLNAVNLQWLAVFIALPIGMYFISNLRRNPSFVPQKHTNQNNPIAPTPPMQTGSSPSWPSTQILEPLDADAVLRLADEQTFSHWAAAAALRPGARLVCAPARAHQARVAAGRLLDFTPAYGDSVVAAFAQAELAMASGSGIINDDAEEDDTPAIAALMAHSSWPLSAEGGVRAQYNFLSSARREADDAASDFFWHPANDNDYNTTSAAPMSQYLPLSIPAAQVGEGSGGRKTGQMTTPRVSAFLSNSPLYAWPFAELLPLPSFVSTGHATATLAAATGAGNDAWPRAAATMVSRAAANPGAPIHATIDCARLGGAHARDSLLLNASAPRVSPVLARAVVFTLAPDAAARLNAGEMAALDSAFGRACASLATAYSASLREAAAARGASARTNNACAKKMDAEAPSSSSSFSLPSSPAPLLVLTEINVDIFTSDVSAFPSAAARGGVYEGLPIPHAAMNEAYAITIDTQADNTADANANGVNSKQTTQLLTGTIVAESLWGALRALTTTVAVLEPWLVDDAPAGNTAGARAATAAAKSAADAVAAGCPLKDVDHKLLPPPAPIRLPLAIVDAPWKLWRGLLVDTARHFIRSPLSFAPSTRRPQQNSTFSTGTLRTRSPFPSNCPRGPRWRRAASFGRERHIRRRTLRKSFALPPPAASASCPN